MSLGRHSSYFKDTHIYIFNIEKYTQVTNVDALIETRVFFIVQRR